MCCSGKNEQEKSINDLVFGHELDFKATLLQHSYLNNS